MPSALLPIGYVDGRIGQRRATPRGRVELDDQVIGAIVAGHGGGPVDLGAVPLAVVEGEGQRRRLRLPLGQGHAHGRVETAGEDDQMAGHGQRPGPATRSTQQVGVSQRRTAVSSSPAADRRRHASWASRSAVGLSTSSLRYW